MNRGNLAEYEKWKAVIFAKISEYEADFAKQPSEWRKLNQQKLREEIDRVLGPEFAPPEKPKTLAEWVTAAREARKSFQTAIAARNYQLAARCEKFAELAEQQAGISKAKSNQGTTKYSPI